MSGDLTAAEYLALGDKARARKYRNVPIRTEEGHFDSTGEYRRWCELKLLRDAGAIADLQRQVRYSLWVGDIHVCDYIADFVYLEPNPAGLFPDFPTETIVEDWKGHRTQEYKIKAKLMRACLGLAIRETGARDKAVPPPGGGRRREGGRKGEEEDGRAGDGQGRARAGSIARR